MNQLVIKLTVCEMNILRKAAAKSRRDNIGNELIKGIV